MTFHHRRAVTWHNANGNRLSTVEPPPPWWPELRFLDAWREAESEDERRERRRKRPAPQKKEDDDAGEQPAGMEW